MDDGVARDAKRLLLRYGAPISVVEKLPDDARIRYARAIVKVGVPDRPYYLKELLAEDGWMPKPDPNGKGKKSKSRSKSRPKPEFGSRSRSESSSKPESRSKPASTSKPESRSKSKAKAKPRSKSKA